MTEHTLSPTENPAEAQRIINEALAESSATSPVQDRPLKTLPDTQVRLAGGYETQDGEYVYDVEVRELIGEDEEALAKSPSVARALMTIINRATVRIGDRKATPELLDRMLAGDRELVLLAIRKVTYGATEDFSVGCPGCNAEQTVTLDLDKDIKVKALENPADRYWEMSLRAGRATVCLPDGAIQRKLAVTSDKTVAEMNTLLLAECVQSIGEYPSLGIATARGLGLADRDAILREIVKRQPGPQLGEVVKQCESCGVDIPINANLALLFRL